VEPWKGKYPWGITRVHDNNNAQQDAYFLLWAHELLPCHRSPISARTEMLLNPQTGALPSLYSPCDDLLEYMLLDQQALMKVKQPFKPTLTESWLSNQQLRPNLQPDEDTFIRNTQMEHKVQQENYLSATLALSSMPSPSLSTTCLPTQLLSLPTASTAIAALHAAPLTLAITSDSSDAQQYVGMEDIPSTNALVVHNSTPISYTPSLANYKSKSFNSSKPRARQHKKNHILFYHNKKPGKVNTSNHI